MNSVHELGSRTMSKKFDSGKYRVEPGQKQAECTECTTQGQPARCRACWAPRPRACRAPVPTCRARPCRAPYLPRVPAARHACRTPCLLCATPATPSPAPHARPTQRPCACLRAQHTPARAPAAQPLLYRGLAGHYIAIQSNLALAPQSQYKFCIAIQITSLTQLPLLQYTPVYCNSNPTLQASFSAIQ